MSLGCIHSSYDGTESTLVCAVDLGRISSDFKAWIDNSQGL